MRPGLFVFDVTGLGIDHVEEPADVLPVLLHWPTRCAARAESVALVGPAHPVIVVAAAFTLADREPFAIDIEGEQHWSGAVGCAVFIGSGAGIVAAAAGASVHDCQYPRAGTAET